MIEYQQKEYQLRKEEIIGLYFYQFKRNIEKEYLFPSKISYVTSCLASALDLPTPILYAMLSNLNSRV